MQEASSRELLSFLVGTQEFCIDISAVREIKGWTPTTPLPNAPSYVCGVINLRGTVLPVVDLAQRLSIAVERATPQHVIIVAQIGSHVMGLLVSGVCGILTVGDDAIHASPNMGSPETHAYLQGLIIIEDRMVGLLRADQLVPETVMAA